MGILITNICIFILIPYYQLEHKQSDDEVEIKYWQNNFRIFKISLLETIIFFLYLNIEMDCQYSFLLQSIRFSTIK